MEKIIDGYNFFEMEAEKYFAPPSSWSQEKKQEWAQNKIFSGEWYGAQKRDGAFFMFLKDEDGNMYLRPRSRNVKKEFINKINWVPHLHSFFESLSIMNCLLEKAIKRQEKEPLHYYIFDVLAFNGELYLEEPAYERFELLESIPYNKSDYNPFFDDYKYVEWAQYVTGKELWNQIQQLLADGYEGVVITRGDSHYLPGKRTNKDTLKIKCELQETIDCVIIKSNPPTKIYNGQEPELWEYWFDENTNEKILAKDFLERNHTTIYAAYAEGAAVIPVTKNWFYGWAGSLQLGLYNKNKQIVHVGDLSGITEEVRKNWKDYIGTVAEISCMEISEDKNGNKGFRHPRLISWRTDKNPKECSLEQIK